VFATNNPIPPKKPSLNLVKINQIGSNRTDHHAANQQEYEAQKNFLIDLT